MENPDEESRMKKKNNPIKYGKILTCDNSTFTINYNVTVWEANIALPITERHTQFHFKSLLIVFFVSFSALISSFSSFWHMLGLLKITMFFISRKKQGEQLKIWDQQIDQQTNIEMTISILNNSFCKEMFLSQFFVIPVSLVSPKVSPLFNFFFFYNLAFVL